MKKPAVINDVDSLEVVEGLLNLCIEREKEIAELTFELESLKKKIKQIEVGTSVQMKDNNPYLGRKEVLIADGAERQSRHLTDILSSLGYTVVGCAKNSEEAIDLLRKKSPALVVVDTHLPGQDGFQTIREMKRYDSDVRAIMISRSRDRHLVLQAIQAGAEDYICKPVQDTRFLKAVENLLSSLDEDEFPD